MAVNVDVVKGPALPLDARLNRQDAEARQDRWMLELERAAFAPAVKAERGREQHGGAPQRAQFGPAAAEPARPAFADGAAATRAESGAHKARVAPKAAPASALASDAAATGARQAARDALERSAHADAGEQAASAQPAVRHAAEQALEAGLQSASAPGYFGGVIGTGSATGTSVGASGYAAVALRGAGVAEPVGAAGALQLDAARAKAPEAALAFGFAAQPEATAQAVLAELEVPEQAETHAAPPEQFDTGASEQFAKNLLHVYRDAEGVHAWVRDAALSQGQALAVASAMAGEFARTGTPLAALSVNGKKMISSGEAHQSTAEEDEANRAGFHSAPNTTARHSGTPAPTGAL